MRRLLFLASLLLLLRPALAASERPNILLILTDDQTLESMRVMDRTLGRLAAEGTTFSNSIVSYPLCCPSRATGLTGQYAHNHKVMANKPPNGGYGRLDHSNTLPVWLREAGYETAHVGKYLNNYTGPEVPPGWTHWFGLSDPSTYRVYDYTVIEDGKPVHYGEDEDDYQTDVLARKSEALLREMIRSGKPFFLSVAPVPPHEERSDEDAQGTPPRPAPRHQGMFAAEPLPAKASYDEPDVADKPPHIRKLPRFGPARKDLILRTYRARLESLQAVDEMVGRLVDVLEETGQLGRTVIIYTSDNGFFSGEHRLPGGKLLPYEESIRVPLIIRGGGFPAGRTANQPVANIDLAPTIVELTGARARRTMDGRSLLPLALDPSLGKDRALLVEGLSQNSARPSYEGIRTSRWLYVEYHTGAKELYDLQADQLQLTSRHNAPGLRTIRADLARRLAKLRTCAGKSCR
ncbi:MAG TPA: sulfatase [Thermoanaerobaculia bacterium]|jgi:arylsulfatase A-like enzyme|nr:sulfatase [Thermoanaerobaculia bacterium]